MGKARQALSIGALWPRTAMLYGGLLLANALAWAWALAAFHASTVLMGAATLAWLLGLRHALDADHIAAIDNITRRRQHRGRTAEAVGLYFSLGHCTVVVLAAIGVSLTSAAFQGELAGFRDAASTMGAAVSALFLLAIAAINLVALASGWRRLKAAQDNREAAPEAGTLLAQGFPGRFLRPLLECSDRAWQVYLIGFLFGLGFDTASEIGLLAISASQSGHGLPLSAALIFPVLFTAGMALLDTTDSVVMVRLYGWALDTPLRTLRYNLGITFVSVLTAVGIGGIEALQILDGALGDRHFAWLSAGLDSHSAAIGASIVALSLAVLAAAPLLPRRR